MAEANAGLADNEAETAISRLWDISLRWAARWPQVCGFLCELRSFVHRMVLARKLGLYESGLVIASDEEFDLESYQNSGSRLRVRSADMQRLNQTYEWLSLTDSLLFDLGWDRGAKWKDSHSCNEPPQH